MHGCACLHDGLGIFAPYTRNSWPANPQWYTTITINLPMNIFLFHCMNMDIFLFCLCVSLMLFILQIWQLTFNCLCGLIGFDIWCFISFQMCFRYRGKPVFSLLCFSCGGSVTRVQLRCGRVRNLLLKPVAECFFSLFFSRFGGLFIFIFIFKCKHTHIQLWRLFCNTNVLNEWPEISHKEKSYEWPQNTSPEWYSAILVIHPKITVSFI